MEPPARRRPPPRRQARRARRSARRRDGFYLSGVAVLLIGLAAMAAGPYADLTAAQTRVGALQGEQVALDEAVLALQAEAERLQDPAALEEQAREQLGMARPGEIPYIVTNPPQEDLRPVNANPSIPPEVDAPSVVDRLIDWVQGWGR